MFSQSSSSQTNGLQAINELISHLKKYSKHLNCYEDNDNGDEMEQDEIDNNDDDDDDSISLHVSYLNKFCCNHLSKLQMSQLIDNDFFAKIHSFIYNAFKSLLIKSNSNSKFNSNLYKKELNELLSSAELLIDYLTKSSYQIKFDQIDLFVLSVLKSIVNVFNYLQQDETLELKQDLIKAINTILTKLNGLFEKKLIDLSHESSLSNLIKTGNYLLKILSNLNLKESKCVVFVFKLMAHLLIKNKLLLNKSNSALLNTFYKFLHENLFNNLRLLKSFLIKMTTQTTQNENGGSSSFSSQSTSVRANTMSNTQVSLTNNIYQDALRIIKISAFLFKIIRAFLPLYIDQLIDQHANSTFESITNLMSLVNYLIFMEAVQPDFDSLKNQQFNMKQFYQTKQEFIKEFLAGYEPLIQMITSNHPYFAYLIDFKFVQSMLKLATEQQAKADESIEDDDIQLEDSVEEITLFYLIYLNRFDYSKIDDDKIKRLLDNLFDLSEMCEISIKTPVYLAYNDLFFKQGCSFNLQTIANNENLAIEWYDFVLFCSFRLLDVKMTTSHEFKIYYLIKNLLISNEDLELKYSANKCAKSKNLMYQACTTRIQLSHDLIYLISISKSKSTIADQTTSVLNYLKFMLCVLENASLSNDSFIYSLADFKHLILDIVDYYISNHQSVKINKSILSKSLEDYIKQSKFYICYSILANTSLFNSTNNDCLIAFKNNIFANLADLINGLIDSMNQLANFNQQVWLNKLIVQIESKNINKLIEMCINILNTSSTLNQSKYLTESKKRLNKSLTDLIKLPHLDNLFKYHDLVMMSLDHNQQQLKALKQNFNNYKRLYLFFCMSINLNTLMIMDHFNNNDTKNVQHQLEFLIKHCSSLLKSALNNNSEMDPFKSQVTLLYSSIKYQSILFLKYLSSKDLKDNCQFRSKLIDLFLILFDDPNMNIKYSSMECLNKYLTCLNSTSNNKLFADIRKQCKPQVKELLDNYIQRIPALGSTSFKESLVIKSQYFNKIQLMNQIYNQVGDQEQNNNSENLETLDLNDTMNVIMSAMDTTISCTNPNVNTQNSKEFNISYSPKLDIDDDDNTQQNVQCDKLIDQIKSDFNKLIDIYNKESRPIYFKNKIENLIKTISNSNI